jgi:hypothetical protein
VFQNWLTNGHIQGVLAGGALSAEVIVLDADVDQLVRVESVYTFGSREALQSYFDGPAIPLREEGKALFIDTKKATFTRNIGNIVLTK